MADVPVSVRLRTYNVGFGDCFLLTFRYKTLRDHHLLIDCGSTRLPSNSKRKMADYTKHILESVTATTGERLDGIVATHRHKDHISGFGGKAGLHLKAANPGLVLQPWTEDPAVEPDATEPPLVGDDPNSRSLRFTHSLASMELLMEQLAESAADPTAALASATKTALKQIGALGDMNITNRAAVESLRSMGSEPPRYLSHGMDSGLDTVIPGISVDVLGPPTIGEWESVRRQRHTDDSEFWHLVANALGPSHNAAGSATALFPDALESPPADWDPPVNWLVPKLHELRGNQVLSLVRILDRALNNTSLILLLKVGDRRLLFSGDAQIESWEYPLFHAPNSGQLRQTLQWTDVYKVGHHGSLNATPKSLWNMFKRRGTPSDQDRLLTLLSTSGGVHGHAAHGTEVPRATLVDELEATSSMVDSRESRSDDDYFNDIDISTSRHRPLIMRPND